MTFPLTVNYLKSKSRQGKFNELHRFELIEEILENNRSLDDYIQLKEELFTYSDSHVMDFDLLYPEWLTGSISEKDINVYKGIFEDGQQLKYFNDFFFDTKEEHTSNSKGMLTELKAYGKSQKIDREVIAFEGRFYDGILTSYTDKTDNADEYISMKHDPDVDPDLLSSDFNLLKLLIENDCLEILSDEAISEIVTYPLREIEGKINKLETAVREAFFYYELRSDRFYVSADQYLPDGNNGEMTNHDGYYLLEDIFKDLTLSVQHYHVFNDNFIDKSWNRQMIEKLRPFAILDYDIKLLSRLEPIRQISLDRIKLSKEQNKKKIIRTVVIIAIVLAMILLSML